MTTLAEHAEAAVGRPRTAPQHSVIDLVRLLAEHGIPVAPHVGARLFAQLDGDADAVREVAAALTAEQRSGTGYLPNPLPLTASVSRRYDGLRLADWEQELLLAAAVCVDDATETLLEFSGRTMGDLIESELSAHLSFVAGHFSFNERRLRIWVHERARLAERTAAHERLSLIYRDRGDDRRALWHRSLWTIAGEAELTRPLLSLARREIDGDAVWAFDVAREAVAHAGADELATARITAGIIAIGNGFVDDACALLDGVAAADSAVATAAVAVARALRCGVAPLADDAWPRPADADEREWREWGVLTTMLAVLCLERGAQEEALRWADIAGEADAAGAPSGGLREAAAAWVQLLEGGGARAADVDPHFRRLLSAFELALDGRGQEGIRLLVGGDACTEDGVLSGYQNSPLMRAYRGVVEALLRTWDGELDAARETLERTALQVPLAMPFAGLAAVIARRLDLACVGERGALSDALVSALPPGLHNDGLVERGIGAYLAGRIDEAATHIELWADRGCPGSLFGLPGLDEVGPIELPAFVEPADIRRARELRISIRSARAGAWAQEHLVASEASRTIESPFERGRVEALLGATCMTRGDRAAALRHLRAARSLFADAGAGAWEASVAARMSRFGEELSATAATPTAPIVICSADPLAACRAAWAPLLTDRELQVAMLVADGRTNREIATQLHIALRTVEVHVGRLFAKFDVRSRAELTVLAHRTNQYA
ncbi:LuxR C-terminal-related transcriptional regulator [Microbacterium sp.]|uniref:LuxR C-terminal-related transcriptional regulator n=1 Tax=Microbacterium sp. TaxID=51671 RepID=UPI0039E3239E